MTTINEIFRTFGPQYLGRYGQTMPKIHRQVIEAIIGCRTEACGLVLYQCEKCGQSHLIYRSCGNRHCPTCQYHKIQQWLDKRMKQQLPGHHFMLTFTVPEQLRRFIRKNQRVAYSALFKTSSEAIKKLAPDEKYIGGDLPGFLGVLHTWGRTLEYHPHIHYIVPGGALSTTDGLWHPSRIDFYLPVRALSKIFKAKFKEAMKDVGLFDQIPSEVWQLDWNVNSQAVGSSEASLKYLAPYVFKVAISNSRILKVENNTVFFRYTKPHSRRVQTMALNAMEFIRRFLQHVLPTGFMKIRYYGFMNPNCSVPFEKISALIQMAYAFSLEIPEYPESPPKTPICSICGGTLRYLGSFLPGLLPQITLDSS
jgi:hypothetical protein